MKHGVMGLVRALFAPAISARLSASQSSRKGRRMLRVVVGLATFAVLISLGIGVYGRFIYTQPPFADTPAVVDDTQPLPPADEFEELAKNDPVAMLKECVIRYQREVKNGLRATLVKAERIQGQPPSGKEPQEEVIRLCIRGDVRDSVTHKSTVEVLMKWESGAKSILEAKITGALYSEKPGPDFTDGKVITWRPEALAFKTYAVMVNGTLAEGQARYCLRDGGLYGGMLRTFDAWKHRKEAGTLQIEYLEKRVVPQVGNRLCYIVKRICPTPEVDAFELGGTAKTDPDSIAKEGFATVTVMIDAERWLQVGTELRRANGELLASYYFRDVELNPTFPPDTFTQTGLKKK